MLFRSGWAGRGGRGFPAPADGFAREGAVDGRASGVFEPAQAADVRRRAGAGVLVHASRVRQPGPGGGGEQRGAHQEVHRNLRGAGHSQPAVEHGPVGHDQGLQRVDEAAWRGTGAAGPHGGGGVQVVHRRHRGLFAEGGGMRRGAGVGDDIICPSYFSCCKREIWSVTTTTISF